MRTIRKFTPPQHPLPAVLLSLLSLLFASACTLNMPQDTGGIAVAESTEEATVGLSVRIAGPLNGATYQEGVPVHIQARVSNADETVERVEFSLDGSVIQTIPSPNADGDPAFTLTHTWMAAGSGEHTVSVRAFKADGTNSDPASVIVRVRGEGDDGDSDDAEAEDAGIIDETPTPDPVNAPGPTIVPTENGDGDSDDEPSPEAQQQAEEAPPPEAEPEEEDDGEPEEESQPDNSGTPMATFTVGVNVRSGPNLLFNPPIGSLAAGDTAEILAVTSARDWYKIRYYNGEGWVFGNLLTTSGNTSNLPIDNGPPLPTLTPIPPTPEPQVENTANLVINSVDFSGDLEEGATFTIRVTVQNNGGTRTNSGGVVWAVFRADRDDAETGRTEGTFPQLDPGQTFTSEMRMTLNTYINERHNGTFTVDANSQVNETNENDNTATRNIDEL